MSVCSSRRGSRLFTKMRVLIGTVLATVAVGSALMVATHGVQAASSATSFTVYAAYRGGVENTSYSWWTPVRHISGERPWLASLQPDVTTRSNELKALGLVTGTARRQVTLAKDAIYKITGTMTTPTKCAKPVLKKGCGTALVMSITAVTPVGGACAQLAYYESRVFVCATSTELVGITSDPERTDYSSIYIEGRSLKLSGPGTYPLPIGGRIDTFLATGSIRCRPIDPDGALSV